LESALAKLLSEHLFLDYLTLYFALRIICKFVNGSSIPGDRPRYFVNLRLVCILGIDLLLNHLSYYLLLLLVLTVQPLYPFFFSLNSTSWITLDYHFWGGIDFRLKCVLNFVNFLCLLSFFVLPLNKYLLSIIEVFEVAWEHVWVGTQIRRGFWYAWVKRVVFVHLLIHWDIMTHLLFNSFIGISI
jgi:hypothetical protein